MAPESERAKMCGSEISDMFGKYACDLPKLHTGNHRANSGTLGEVNWTKGKFERDAEEERLESAPTLSCSEVVERLAKEAIVPSRVREGCFVLDLAKTEAILHSWRERRVQELEEALRGMLLSATPNQQEHPTMFAAWKKAEQIRKGAKHE